MPGKITMQHIADYLGVSKFAVSKALSGKTGVSEATRELVCRTARELGYTKQKGLRDLNAYRDVPSTGFVAILFPNIVDRYQSRYSYYWGPILEGISAALKDRGLDMITITELTENSNVFKAVNPEGLIGIISVGMISTSLLLEIKELDIPMVLIDHEEPLIACDSLFMNNFDLMRQLTNRLISLGHRNLQFVGGMQYARSFFDRWLGFRTAVEQHVLQYEQEPYLYATEQLLEWEKIRSVIREMNESNTLPSAFVCANDNFAETVIGILNELGVPVPERCSVTGFDNIKIDNPNIPQITTIHVDKERIGQRGVEMLLWRLNNRNAAPEKILLAGDILIRETLSAPVSFPG